MTTFTDATDKALDWVAVLPPDPQSLAAEMEFLREVGMLDVAARLRAADALIGAGRFDAALKLLAGVDSMRARLLREIALSSRRPVSTRRRVLTSSLVALAFAAATFVTLRLSASTDPPPRWLLESSYPRSGSWFG